MPPHTVVACACALGAQPTRSHISEFSHFALCVVLIHSFTSTVMMHKFTCLYLQFYLKIRINMLHDAEQPNVDANTRALEIERERERAAKSAERAHMAVSCHRHLHKLQ